MTVTELLKNLSSIDDEIVYFPNPGNGGDALIASATYDLFDKYNIKYIIYKKDIDLTNKILIYGGGGNLVKEYSQATNFIKEFNQKVKQLIVLPHTINGNKKLLKELKSNVILFAREETSYSYLKELNLECKIYIDHDLAFTLDIKKYLIFPYPRYIAWFFHRLIIRLINKEPLFMLQAMRLDKEKTKVTIQKSNMDLSGNLNFDFSMTDRVLVDKTTKYFLTYINLYPSVRTNRLHVAIGGYLLNKKVMFHSNSYYKNESVFHFSMRNNNKISFQK